jgi:hypothetical protein
MIPASSPAERVALLEGIRAIDAAAFEAALALARTHLSAREYGKLDSRLRGNNDELDSRLRGNEDELDSRLRGNDFQRVTLES